MRIKDIIAISGMSGLYKTEAQKVNGVIVTSLTEGWTRFVSNRQNLFSPLENVSIYTTGDTIDLSEVLIEVYNQQSTNPPVDLKAGDEDIRKWFFKIVPDHDTEKVYISDIKKLIKWYGILMEKGVIEEEIKAREAEAASKEETAQKDKDTESGKEEDKESANTDAPEKKKKAAAKTTVKEASDKKDDTEKSGKEKAPKKTSKKDENS